MIKCQTNCTKEIGERLQRTDGIEKSQSLKTLLAKSHLLNDSKLLGVEGFFQDQVKMWILLKAFPLGHL